MRNDCGVGRPIIQVGVGYKERVSIPQRQHETAHHLAYQFRAKPALVSWRAGGIEIPAHGVSAVSIDDFPWVNHVALVLGHLLPFPIQDQPQADYVLVTQVVKNQRTDRQQRVEPTTGLVYSFANEISWELLFKLLQVFKWIMPLGNGHGT